MRLFRSLDLGRRIRWWWQRRTRGFDDRETWDLDVTIAEFVLPRLRRFKNVTKCYPSGMTEEEWHEMLDGMILAFEWIATSREATYKPDNVHSGLRDFGDYYFDLWW
jgi:hypothetical protein